MYIYIYTYNLSLSLSLDFSFPQKLCRPHAPQGELTPRARSRAAALAGQYLEGQGDLVSRFITRITHIMENQMEKNMDNEMEPGIR